MKHSNLLSRTSFAGLLFFGIILVLASPIRSQSLRNSPREEKLLNGLKLLMFDAPSDNKVTLKVRIHAGSAFDPQGKEGVMKLLATNFFPNPEIKEFFTDQLGGSIEVESNYDYIQITARSDEEHPWA